jgi:peptide/histidine transporter 3/4
VKQNHGLILSIQLVAGALTMLIAGWLADIYFGRYKVIKLSMWTMWISVILATTSSVVAEIVGSYDSISRYVSAALMVTGVIGFGGFQANNIQFGIDQLCDASTTEITAYICWYIWCGYSSEFLVDCTLHVLSCIDLQTYNIDILGSFVICAQLSAALCSTLLFNRCLIKEPITQNPFRLIYNVIRYALRHKQPRFRSAFTYCEDELPSRIDFGKSKYGGPFTTEQVEDVKTLFRILAVGSLVCIELGVAISLFFLKEQISNLLISGHSMIKKFASRCYSEELTQQIFNYSWVIIIPLYEFVFYPLFSQYLAKFNYRIKATIGIVLHTVTIVSLMSIVIIARYNSLVHHTSGQNNVTLECILYEGNEALTLNLDSRWMAVPNFLYSISVAVLGISGIEFGISQAPYSMRGLIMGSAYGVIALATALSIAVSVPFMKRSNSIVWGTGVISCEFWYTLLLLFTETVVGGALVIAMMLYKKRKREDVLPNEHIFAERYYSQDY